MALTFIGIEIGETGADDDIVVNVPAGTLDGHSMLAFYTYTDNDGTGVTVTGFTELEYFADATGPDTTQYIGKRVASSEPASYTFTGDAVEDTDVQACIIVYSGGHADVVDATYVRASHYLKPVDTNAPTPKPVTTTVNGSEVIIYLWYNGGDTSAISLTGYTERLADYDANRNMWVATKTIPTFGTETPGALVMTGTTAARDGIIVTLTLKPAAAAGGILPSGIQKGNINSGIFSQ